MWSVPSQHCCVHPCQGVQLEEPQDHTPARQAHFRTSHVRQVRGKPKLTQSVLDALQRQIQNDLIARNF